ncbi:MAG: serine hydrolase domain-containing protein [Bacteroidota bacterium]
MKIYIPVFAFFLISSCSTPESSESYTFQVSEPAAYGLDQEEIAEIENHLQRAIDSTNIAGVVALVVKEDKIIYHKAFGFSDRAKTSPMKTNNIFRLASMTKPITSTAVMQLVEQGKIGLNDPVSKYIPEFSDTRVIDTFDKTDSSYTTKPLARPLTIHHLLTHTSGIPYAVFNPIAGKIYPQFGFVEAWTKDPITLAENIPKQGKAPLLHQPGEKWTYGTGIDVLGYIVEIVSGMPLDKYFEENIFKPLGMIDTYFYLPDDKADRLVEVWFKSDADESPDELSPVDYPIAGAKTYFPGGAGLVGTALDYAKFATAIKDRGVFGDSRILMPSTVAKMLNNQIDTLRRGGGEAFGYGGSVLVQDDGSKNAGRWGWGGYWQTFFSIDPQNDLVIILMTNAFGNTKWGQIVNGYDSMVVQGIED